MPTTNNAVGSNFKELYAFLEGILVSNEFKAVAAKAAKKSGYSVSDDLTDEKLNTRARVVVRQVLLELTDERFLGRTHHRRSLYNHGCHQPLCLKAERDRSRQRYRRSNGLGGVAPARKVNKRISLFDDEIINLIAKKYDCYARKQDL